MKRTMIIITLLTVSLTAERIAVENTYSVEYMLNLNKDIAKCPNYDYVGQRSEIIVINHNYKKVSKTIFACKENNKTLIRIDTKEVEEKNAI